MVDEPDSPQPLTLKRWSQKKRDAARKAATGAPNPVAPDAVPATAPLTAAATPAAAVEAAPLPPVESLDFESDYSAFMQPKVSEETKRAALKKLFSDPSFNVMDGLDIYVGDYTQPDPMPAGMLEKLSAVYAMVDPPSPPEAKAEPAESRPAAGVEPVAAPESLLPAAQPEALLPAAMPASPTPAEAPPKRAAETPPAPVAAADGQENPA